LGKRKGADGDPNDPKRMEMDDVSEASVDETVPPQDTVRDMILCCTEEGPLFAACCSRSNF